MNSNLSGIALKKIIERASIVLVFESTKGRKNAADAGTSLQMEPPRHRGGNNYDFADGHGKWSKVKPNFSLAPEMNLCS